MDDRLKTLYEAELHHLETHAAEFVSKSKYARIAERLGLGESAQLRDPFIDWLLDGSAFLAARIHHLIESEFPRFTQALTSVVYPHLAAPTPSMMVVQFGFDQAGKAALGGPLVNKDMQLYMRAYGRRNSQRQSDAKRVTFTTGRSIRLWPLHATEAEFLPNAASLAGIPGAENSDAACGIRVKLSMQCEGTLGDATLDEMDIFLGGGASIAPILFDALALSGPKASVVIGADRKRGSKRATPVKVAPLGFENEVTTEGVGTERDALMPYDRRSFEGYRLLHEYFALPDRFHFIRLSGLQRALEGVAEREATLVFLMDRAFESLTGRVGPEAFKLNCVPAVNLFPKSADNIDFDAKRPEHHIVPDADDPTAYEIHSVTSVIGRTEQGERMTFRPFFSTSGLGTREPRSARFYALDRRRRNAPVTLEDDPLLKEYRGSEVVISLVDEAFTPFRGDLRALMVETLCSNRHLPLYRRTGDIDLTSSEDFGSDWIRVVAGPSEPRAGLAEGRRQWDVVSHLSLNHLSLLDSDGEQAAEALRQMMRLYAPRSSVAPASRMISNLRRVQVEPAIGRLHPAQRSGGGMPQPIVFGRGLDIELTFDESEVSASALGAVLERFMAGYSPANSFTRTSLRAVDGEVRVRWPTRAGLRTIL